MILTSILAGNGDGSGEDSGDEGERHGKEDDEDEDEEDAGTVDSPVRLFGMPTVVSTSFFDRLMSVAHLQNRNSL